MNIQMIKATLTYFCISEVELWNVDKDLSDKTNLSKGRSHFK